MNVEVETMGAYSMAVVPRLHGCPGCGDEGAMTLQFHFGHTFQDTYRIGERLKWGGNDKGTPGQERAEVIGYQEACGGCGLDEDREYVLVFEHDVLTGGHRYALPEDLLRLG
ncbi:hypothetical protein [Streptomyces sp. NPDC001139]